MPRLTYDLSPLLHLPPCSHQSANVAYKYGVSGPFWYASGATIQVLLFAVLAVEVKRKVSGAERTALGQTS